MNTSPLQTITIHPVDAPLKGHVRIPGSKSLTNRAFLVAGFAKGESLLSGVLESDDTIYMARALRQMGVSIDKTAEDEYRVSSPGHLSPPKEPLFLGNAGTATRFITAAAALINGEVIVDGDEYMRKRLILPLVEALQQLDIDVQTSTGCPPVTIKGTGTISGNLVEIDAGLSSQYVSALLMMASCAGQPLEIRLKGQSNIGAKGYLDLTFDVMRAFGAEIEALSPSAWRVLPTGYKSTNYNIEPDASSATYVWGAEALTNGKIELSFNPETSQQPDAKSLAFIRQFPHMPAEIEGSQMQDSILTLAVLAAFNENPVRFTGIENLRVKECDRIRALSQGLNQIKPGLAVEDGDDLIVYGDPNLKPANERSLIDSHDDHRIAMCFALAGLRVPGITITNPDCVGKTFPGYWDMLRSLGVKLST